MNVQGALSLAPTARRADTAMSKCRKCLPSARHFQASICRNRASRGVVLQGLLVPIMVQSGIEDLLHLHLQLKKFRARRLPAPHALMHALTG